MNIINLWKNRSVYIHGLGSHTSKTKWLTMKYSYSFIVSSHIKLKMITYFLFKPEMSTYFLLPSNRKWVLTSYYLQTGNEYYLLPASEFSSSHVAPDHMPTHLQANMFSTGMHSPSFMHGLGSHTSKTKTIGDKILYTLCRLCTGWSRTHLKPKW